MRHWLWLFAAGAGLACAQAPVEQGPRPPDMVLGAQQKAGMAYQDWQDAVAARAQAEQELRQADAAYQAAQQQLGDSKQRAAAAQQALAAAKAREAATRTAYDKASAAVDRAWGRKTPPPK